MSRHEHQRKHHHDRGQHGHHPTQAAGLVVEEASLDAQVGASLDRHEHDERIMKAAFHWKHRVEAGRVSLEDLDNGNVEEWFLDTCRAIAGDEGVDRGRAIFLDVLGPALGEKIWEYEKRLELVAFNYANMVEDGKVALEQLDEVRDWYFTVARTTTGLDDWKGSRRIFREVLAPSIARAKRAHAKPHAEPGHHRHRHHRPDASGDGT